MVARLEEAVIHTCHTPELSTRQGPGSCYTPDQIYGTSAAHLGSSGRPQTPQATAAASNAAANAFEISLLRILEPHADHTKFPDGHTLYAARDPTQWYPLWNTHRAQTYWVPPQWRSSVLHKCLGSIVQLFPQHGSGDPPSLVRSRVRSSLRSLYVPRSFGVFFFVIFSVTQ